MNQRKKINIGFRGTYEVKASIKLVVVNPDPPKPPWRDWLVDFAAGTDVIRHLLEAAHASGMLRQPVRI